MDNILSVLSRLVTARPYVTLAILLVVTVVLGAGGTLRAPFPEIAATLPKGSAVAEALEQIDERFGDAGDVRVVTLLFRGETMTPDGLGQMASLVGDIVSEPGVGELLAPAEPVVAPSALVMALLRVDGFESVTQAEIDTLFGPPEILAALDAMTGTDTDGTPVAVASIRLIDTGDERVEDAERRIDELASADEGPLRVSSISFVVIEDESREAAESGMAPLIGPGAVADRRPDPAVHAHDLGPAADVSGAAHVADLDCGRRGLAGAQRARPYGPAELADGDGADHRDRSHGGLRDPGGLALP